MSAAMAVGMLSGCGSSSSTKSETGSVVSGDDAGGQTTMSVDGDYTTLTVWTFIELHQEFYTTMAKKWNEEHPDEKVKLVLSNMQYDDMHNKLSLALESAREHRISQILSLASSRHLHLTRTSSFAI